VGGLKRTPQASYSTISLPGISMLIALFHDQAAVALATLAQALDTAVNPLLCFAKLLSR
jgi:hypothetical protein